MRKQSAVCACRLYYCHPYPCNWQEAFAVTSQAFADSQPLEASRSFRSVQILELHGWSGYYLHFKCL